MPPRLRPYTDRDWEAVLEICLLAFAPACESLDRLEGAKALAQTGPNWGASIGTHLRSLAQVGQGGRLLVAESRGAVVGVIHYEVDAVAQSGCIGVSAVHPSRQGQGIGTLMCHHVLEAMRAQGVRYVTADTENDASRAPARRIYQKLGFVAVPMVHYFKGLATREQVDGGHRGRSGKKVPTAARPARPRKPSRSRARAKRR